jgi:transcriptional regulator with XRE-family HTH domain
MTKRSRKGSQTECYTGDLIARRRVELQLTQKQLYLLSELRGGESVISQYEGNRRIPSIYALRSIASALETNMETLVGTRVPR